MHDLIGTSDSKAFIQNHLHAKYISSSSNNFFVKGVDTDSISNGLVFHIWQPQWADYLQSPEVIEPAEGASTLFTYLDDQGAAVKFDGDHKVVYMGFGLEAVDSYTHTSIGNPSIIRTELLNTNLELVKFY